MGVFSVGGCGVCDKMQSLKILLEKITMYAIAFDMEIAKRQEHYGELYNPAVNNGSNLPPLSQKTTFEN